MINYLSLKFYYLSLNYSFIITKPDSILGWNLKRKQRFKNQKSNIKELSKKSVGLCQNNA